MNTLLDHMTRKQLDRRHPIQYGYRGNDIVLNPGNALDVHERYNRCPTCEQWSPCDVRIAWEKAHKR